MEPLWWCQRCAGRSVFNRTPRADRREPASVPHLRPDAGELVDKFLRRLWSCNPRLRVEIKHDETASRRILDKPQGSGNGVRRERFALPLKRFKHLQGEQRLHLPRLAALVDTMHQGLACRQPREEVLQPSEASQLHMFHMS